MEFQYDLIVLGAGPGGYVAAIRASQLGLKTAVVEKKQVGGVCLNIGCIPSKNLIHSAGLFAEARQLEAFGVRLDASGFDYAAVHAQSRKVADTLSKGVRFLLDKNHITLIADTGTLTDAHTVQLASGEALTARHLLIATGSSPRVIPGLEFDGDRVLSSDNVLLADKLPESMCIIGGGAIGCEFAYILRSFGVEVTLVEMTPHLLPYEDEEIAKALSMSFKKKGIAVHLESKAAIVEKTAVSVTVAIENASGVKKLVTAEQVLAVVGRGPNTAGIGLEAVGIATDRGFIPVNEHFETAVPGVYAIGDIIPTPMLAHVASHEGEQAVAHMAGQHHTVKKRFVPNCVYCEPQVAGFGITSAQAVHTGAIAYSVPFRAIGKAVAIGKSEGLVKILADSDGNILGAHILGAEATELIHELAIAASNGVRMQDIADSIHAHPTLSEALKECCCGFENRSIHI